MMKRILLILLPAVLFISCERHQYQPSGEVPEWLNQKIVEIEGQIRENPKTGFTISAWIRYTYNDEYYFEWHNLLSSSYPPIYDFDGNRMFFRWDNNDDYQKGKCCKQYIWKGPSWSDEFNGW